MSPLRVLLVSAVLALCFCTLLPISHAAESAPTAVDEVEVDVAETTLPDIPPAPTDGSTAAASSSTDPPPKNKEPISLTRPDFCRACYSVVEEFHKWTVRNFNDPASRRNTTMTRGELVEWFCRTGAFEHWKEPLMWGCIKTVQDHHDDVLAPFLGTHTSHEYTTLGAVFKHRVAACAKIDACDAWQPEARAKTDCEACERVAKDIKWSLDREQKVNRTIVEKTLRVLCMEVGMRHEKPMEAEAFCHEYVDEHWFDMQKMLVKVYNDPEIYPYQREGEIKKRFCGGMTEVCETDRVQMAEEIKQRKEKERAARLAARAANKIGDRKKIPKPDEEKDEL